MPRPHAALIALLAFPLAGCIAFEARCADDPGLGPPFLAAEATRGPPQEVADRFAAAFGLPALEGKPSEDDHLAWGDHTWAQDGARVTLEYREESFFGGELTLDTSSWSSGPAVEDQLRDAVRVLALPEGVIELGSEGTHVWANYSQPVDGIRFTSPGIEVHADTTDRNRSVVLRRMHEPVDEALDAGQAAQAGDRAIRCLHEDDWSLFRDPSPGLSGNRFAWYAIYQAPGGECAALKVLVLDARTGGLIEHLPASACHPGH